MRTLARWQRRRTRPAARGSSSHNPHYVWRPAFSPAVRAAQSFAGAPLCCQRWCRSVATSHRHPRRLRCCSAAASSCGSQSKRLSAGGLRLKGLYARPASSGCGGSCRAKAARHSFPASPASAARPGPAWSCKGQLRSGSGATERRSVACGLSAARPADPRRGPAMPPVAAGGTVTGCRKRT